MSRSIFELAYRYIEPAVKRQLVIELYKRGITRSKITEITGISQSLITRYILGERGSKLDLTPYRDIISLITKLAEKAPEIERIKLEEEIYKITLYFLSKKYFCNTHVILDKNIDPVKCQICPTLFKIAI